MRESIHILESHHKILPFYVQYLWVKATSVHGQKSLRANIFPFAYFM
jgi:hypothetical protein